MRALLGSVIIVASLGGAARADEAEELRELAAEARRLAQEGQDTGDVDKLRRAAALYFEAYERSGNPAFQCNMALAYKLVGELPLAHAAFSECLPRLPATMPDAVQNFQAALDEVIAALPAEHVAVDVVTAPRGATLALELFHGHVAPIAPTVVWLPAGEHSITATLPGHRSATEAVTVAAGDGAKKVVIRLAPEEEEKKEAIVVDPPPPVTTSSSKRTYGWITLGIGGGLGVAGGIMHAIAYKTGQEAADLPRGGGYEEKIETFRNQRLVCLSLYGVGAAAVITGAYLLTRTERISITPAPSGTGAVVWLDL